MSAANDLIMRLEEETGHRIDEKNSPAMTGLLGAISRKMGLSPDTYREQDDVAVGVVLQSSPPSNDDMLAMLLLASLEKVNNEPG